MADSEQMQSFFSSSVIAQSTYTRTKIGHQTVNASFYIKNNDGVSPVETQNLASHEQKARQRQAFTHLTSLRIIACETQEARQRQAYIHLTSLRILACETQEARQRRAFTSLASLRIIACETQNFESLLWIIHIYSALFSCIKQWRL